VACFFHNGHGLEAGERPADLEGLEAAIKASFLSGIVTTPANELAGI